MPSHSFKDLSHKTDDMTGTDYFKDRVDPWKRLAVSFSARPKKNVSTAFNWTDQVEWDKEGNAKESRKTDTKISKNCDNWHLKTDWTFAADKFAAKLSRNDLVEGDWHVDADATFEVKPAKDEWKVEGHVHGHTPDFSCIRGFFDNNVEHNSKKETKIKSHVSFAHEDMHHLGVYFEHDTKDFTRLWAQLAFTPRDAQHHNFLRYDVQKHFVSVGHHHDHKNGAQHAFEVTYDAADGAKGLYGTPLGAKSAASYKLSDHTHLKTALWWNANYGAEMKVEHKIDDHWTVGTHQEFDSSNLKAKQGPHNLGFKVNYKL